MGSFSLNASQIADYNRDGYIVVKSLFSVEEVGKLYHTAIENSVMQKNAMDLNDQTGKNKALALVYAGR